MNIFGLSQAVVPVTGGASGIGLAISRLIRAEGGRPILLDINPDQLHAATAELYPGEDPARFGHVVDVRDAAAVDAAFDKLRQDHGPATHAVACAGIVWRGKTMDMPEDAWNAVLDVNVNGVLHTCRAAARQMAGNGGGAIVNIASIGGLRARLDRTAYATSKAAVIHMTRALALELGPDGIRLNCVAPGLIKTEMQKASAAFMGSAESVTGVAGRGALGRMGEPEEIARPVLFLLSDLSSYITGETLVVDGGVNVRYA